MHISHIVAITTTLICIVTAVAVYLRQQNGDSDYLKSSTWTISIPDESVTQTWYIDTEADVLKIVQHKEAQAGFAVQELHASKTYLYSVWDRIDSTVPASACDDVNLADNTEFADCDAYVAHLQAQLDDAPVVKVDCSIEEITESSSVAAIEVSGDNVVVGGFTVQFTNGVPTAIISGDDGSLVATIDSIVEGIAGDVTFDGCEVADSRRLEIEERRLGFAEWASNTEWCGAGTDNCNTPCPGSKGSRGSLQDNMGCRRHDHGAVHSSALMGFGVQLECQVDKDLVDYANKNAGDRANTAIQAAFGKYGLANAWGCKNWANVQDCWWHWAGCGWRSCPGFERRCSSTWQWEVKNGFGRYDNINHRGDGTIYVDKCQTCSGDIF
jgi:hypothetical protein